MSAEKLCDATAAFRYTWPGRDEAYICAEHSAKLSAIANSIGCHIQLIPLLPVSEKEHPKCQQYNLTQTAPRKGKCSVGFGGNYTIPTDGLMPGCKFPHTITWLPKGYGQTRNDFVVALVACPPGEDWGEYGLGIDKRPPLIDAICKTIEEYMEAKNVKA